MSLTYAQIEGVWTSAAAGTKYSSHAWAALMAAIAMAESAGDPNATNPNDNGGTQTSWGLWQISLGNHTAPAPNWNDPAENARLAIGKLNTQGLTAWGTYTSGAYKKWFNGAIPAASLTAAHSGGSGGTDNTSTWKASTQAISSIPGLSWMGSIITGFTGIPTGLGDIATSLGAMVTDLSKFMKAAMWLFKPDSWLRIAAGITGLVCLGGGAYMLKEAI